jgi:hypothetical protein
VGLKVNGARQLLVYAGDVNLLGDNIKNTNSLFGANMEVSVEENAEKS